MANLSGSLSQVGSVVLLTEAANQFSTMCTAFGSAFQAKLGYASEWDLYKEYADCYINPDQSLIDKLKGEIKPLIEKPDPTESDRGVIKSFFQNTHYSDFDFKTLYPGIDWTHHTQWKTSWAHPFFAEGTDIYGFPNTLALDPRRSGRWMLLTGLDENSQNWLYQNSYTYGWVWYGPIDGAFMYIGTDKTSAMKESSKAALKLGMHANMHNFIQAATGTAPTTIDDVKNYINSIPQTGYNSNGTTIPRANFDYNHWSITMNPAGNS